MNIVMQRNYPDYNRISEVVNQLEEASRGLRGYAYDFSDEVRDLQRELQKLIMGEEMVEVTDKSCKEARCEVNNRAGWVYYPGKVHHLDGDVNNEFFGNLAMVCPKCQAHILLSRFHPKDIWLLKARGLSNAEVGRLLNLSRERVRQLCKKYEAKQRAELSALIQADLDDLVKKAEYIEDALIASGRLKRRIDRRTKKKRIIAELNRLRAKEAQNERKYKAKEQK